MHQSQAQVRPPMPHIRQCGECLASLDRCSEDVRAVAIVIPELKFRNVQRHVFGADPVECADDPALEDPPEAFNRVCVDRADNILPSGMVNRAVRISGPSISVVDL